MMQYTIDSPIDQFTALDALYISVKPLPICESRSLLTYPLKESKAASAAS
jgi:hypothetical protein